MAGQNKVKKKIPIDYWIYNPIYLVHPTIYFKTRLINTKLFLYNDNGEHIKGEEIIYPIVEEEDEEDDEEGSEEDDECDLMTPDTHTQFIGSVNVLHTDIDIVDIVINPNINIQSNIPY